MFYLYLIICLIINYIKLKLAISPQLSFPKMSTNTDWDVDYYKTDYESEEHWDLRRSFMLAHKDKFGEDELVCLAQVFTNVEFMGCRYPEETMRRVGMLSQEVAAEFRKSRAKKLKRTFVGAQDAAGAKAKGRSKNCEFTNQIFNPMIQ